MFLKGSECAKVLHTAYRTMSKEWWLHIAD